MSEKTEFLPFHAINEFMRPDFKLNVVRETLTTPSSLNSACMNEISKQIKKSVKIPGFRNSDKAPAMVKVLPTSKAFEKHPDLVAAILNCWAEIHNELRDQVFRLLVDRHWQVLSVSDDIEISKLSPEIINNWPILPVDMDRTKLPGFFIHWPKGEDFEVLYDSFAELYPDSDASKDKVSLMVVWLTMRLPYQVDSEFTNLDNNSTTEISE